MANFWRGDAWNEFPAPTTVVTDAVPEVQGRTWQVQAIPGTDMVEEDEQEEEEEEEEEGEGQEKLGGRLL